MLNDISVLIPYKRDNGLRDVTFNWIKEYYKATMPEVEICIGESRDELFNRSKALNYAAGIATRNVFVIADGDVFFDPDLLNHSYQLLEKYTWLIPFNTVINLSEQNSNRILTMSPKWPIEQEITDYSIRTYANKNSFTGKLNVIKRSHYELVGGFDERFEGWGGEDRAFGYAVNTLCGRFQRLDRKIFHLWHPHIGYKNNPNGEFNSNLRNLYKGSNGNKEEMKRIIAKS